MARKADKKLYPILHSPFVSLRHLQQFLDRRFEQSGTLTPCQLMIMEAVIVNDVLTQAGITRLTGVDRSTLSDTLRRLQEVGWLKRRINEEDRRTLSVSATAEGVRVYKQALAGAKDIEASFVGMIPSTSRASFLITLRELCTRAAKFDADTAAAQA